MLRPSEQEDTFPHARKHTHTHTDRDTNTLSVIGIIFYKLTSQDLHSSNTVTSLSRLAIMLADLIEAPPHPFLQTSAVTGCEGHELPPAPAICFIWEFPKIGDPNIVPYIIGSLL